MAERYILLIAMIPAGALIQFAYMTWRLNGEWQKMTPWKKFGTIFMGGISSLLTGLWLADNETLSLERRAFFMSFAAIAGGEGIQLVNNFLRNQLQKRLGKKESNV